MSVIIYLQNISFYIYTDYIFKYANIRSKILPSVLIYIFSLKFFNFRPCISIYIISNLNSIIQLD